MGAEGKLVMQSPIDNPTFLDRLGIWISSLCALHCLAIPLLPLLASSMFGQTWFERTILSLSILIGSVALIIGAVRYHGKKRKKRSKKQNHKQQRHTRKRKKSHRVTTRKRYQ